ncbi:DNA-directed RNA polymerase subunit beta' [Ceratobasidium sp. AG-Ba]|nr:DNA-directed RNA polymerase subunit beta' [Ceratobasidium sp. AG-Ba]QRW12141.1 DNA-directed RNA polymerase subunit beta' [Ceratobasidium sp. AG-Ba]
MSHPNASQVHIILEGPHFGTKIVCSTLAITQTVLKKAPIIAHEDPFPVKRRSRDEERGDGVLGPSELMTVISKTDAAALRQRIVTSLYVSAKRLPGNKGRRVVHRPTLTVEPISIPIPTPQLQTHIHTLAWYAGRLAAEMPATVDRIAQELKTNEPMSSCPCDSHRQATAATRDPATKADIEVFVESYFNRRDAVLARSAKLDRLRERVKAKCSVRNVTDTNEKLEGHAQKRRRCAPPTTRIA